MVKKKRQSKRMAASTKYKIEKKVREHKRKVRKQEKLKSGSKRQGLKKDPGIPNKFPLKEQTLKQIQEAKEREIAKRQKEARMRQLTKRRSLDSLRADAEKRQSKFEKKENIKKLSKDDAPHHKDSTKQYIREFKKVIEEADVVLEVLDARDPLACRCIEMEQAILSSGSDKKLILVLNKIDLAPRDNVKEWLKYLRNEFPAVAFKSSTQSQKHNLSCKRFPLESGSVSLEKSSVCLGSEVLMKMLGNYCQSQGLKKSITVGVVGLPNVGKSSIINSLKRNRVCTVGAIAGVTKVMQKIQLDSHISLLDSPGVVMASESPSDSRLVLCNSLKVECLSDVITPVEYILKRCEKTEVMKRYCIPSYEDAMEFCTLLAKRTGKLRKGGIPDFEAAAKAVLHDWNNGRISYYTCPPEQSAHHVAAEIVHNWGKAFDMPTIASKDDDILAGLSERLERSLVVKHGDPVPAVLQCDSSDDGDSDLVEMSDLEDDTDSDDDSAEEMEEDERPSSNVVVSMQSSKRGKKKKQQVSHDDSDEEKYDFQHYFKN